MTNLNSPVRHCERSEAIQQEKSCSPGLLRYARNDDMEKFLQEKWDIRAATKYLLVVFVSTCLGWTNPAAADEAEVPLEKVHIDLTDLASLQRGAQLFINHCAACHSLKYVRYNTLAKDIGIVDSSGQVLEKAVKDNLMFATDNINDSIQTAFTKEEGAAWFGVAPPDLTLVARSRGIDWLYTYLRTFYLDEKRPWGVNNKVFPDVAMPDVLYNFRMQLYSKPDGAAKYDAAVRDLVNFLAYASEPFALKRQHIGIWVLLFLGIFFVFAWLLKREYWKDVH